MERYIVNHEIYINMENEKKRKRNRTLRFLYCGTLKKELNARYKKAILTILKEQQVSKIPELKARVTLVLNEQIEDFEFLLMIGYMLRKRIVYVVKKENSAGKIIYVSAEPFLEYQRTIKLRQKLKKEKVPEIISKMKRRSEKEKRLANKPISFFAKRI